MKAAIAVPATLVLCYRAWSHKSLTPAGIVVAALTAVAHAVHPWNLPFVLLVVFFLAGTRVTKIKKDVKEQLTVQSTGSSGEGPRTHIQVLANSGVASVLTVLHAYQLRKSENTCYPWGGDLLLVGIIANYAAVAADTFSSELGILSKSTPRLITSLTLRKVPKGTNGGVTLWGLAAGLLGSLVIVTAALAFTPFCGVRMVPTSEGLRAPLRGLAGGHGWDINEKQYFSWALVLWGALGSVLDSFLGGWFQQSVVDKRTGRIVEGEGGRKVLVSKGSMHSIKGAEVRSRVLHHDGKDAISKPSFGNGEPTRVVENGLPLLDNNQVNFLMALIMSLGAMGIAGWAWNVPLSSIWKL